MPNPKRQLCQDQLRALGLSPAEITILETVRLTPTNRTHLIKHASCPTTSLHTVNDGQALNEAVSSLIDKGWIQIIDSHVLEHLRESLDSRGLEPLYGFPRVGDVDFTQDGATKYMTATFGFPDDAEVNFYSKPDSVAEYETHYYIATRDQVREHTEFLKDLADVAEQGQPTLLGIDSIGPWCARWWGVVDNGYRIRVLYRWPA